jgi:predicted permease
MPTRILSFFRNLLRKRTVEQALDDELRSSLEVLTQERTKQGFSQSVARRDALIELGGIEQVKEEVRAARAGRVLEDFVRDVRFGFRTLAKSPGFTTVAVLTLALGIAFTTAAFSVAVGVLRDSLPYKGADRMVSFYVANPVHSLGLQLPISQFLTFRRSPVLDDAVAWDFFPMSTKFNALPEAVHVGWFSPNAFRFYGVRMLVGAPFTNQPLVLGGEPPREAVLSWDFWQSHFGGSRNVLGKSIELDSHLYTITGVLPERFEPFDLDVPVDADLYVALPLKSDLNHVYVITARLKSGITPAAATSALQPLVQRFAIETPTHYPRNFRLHVDLLNSKLQHRYGKTFSIILATALVLLAIACLNVSVLLLARGTTRKHEFAIRAALGAGRGRLFRQLLTESLFLAVAGGSLGVAGSYGLLHFLPFLMPSRELPPSAQIQLSLPVLVFAVMVSLACGILFGMAPALRFGQGHLRMEFGTRGAAGDQTIRQLHSALMIVQVAATLVMVTAAVVAISTVLRLYAAPLGFDPKGLTSFDVELSEGTFTTWPARTQYYARLRDEVATLASVKSVALSVFPLPPVSRYIVPIHIQGSTSTGQSATFKLVGQRFFQTLKVPLLRGRIWTNSEIAHAANLAVINQAMAREYWPKSDPIGQAVTSDGLKSRNVWMLQAPTNHAMVQIIGVVGDTPNEGLLKPALPTLYVPYTLLTGDGISLVVRARLGFEGSIVREVRGAVARVNGNQPFNLVESAEQRLRKAGWLDQQFLAVLFLLFACAAGILSAIGIYSVVSYSVSQRLKEYGIRMALGASRLDILWTSTKTVALNLAIGLIAGAVVSTVLSRLMTRWTELNHLNMPLLILATIVLIAVGILATLLPAMRACNMKPMDVLRLDQ